MAGSVMNRAEHLKVELVECQLRVSSSWKQVMHVQPLALTTSRNFTAVVSALLCQLSGLLPFAALKEGF